MYCPVCRDELRPEYDTCPVCGAGLVDELPQEEHPELVVVGTIANESPEFLSAVAAVLRGCGVPYMLSGADGDLWFPRSSGIWPPADLWGSRAIQVLCREEDVSSVRGALSEIGGWISLEEDADDAEELDS